MPDPTAAAFALPQEDLCLATDLYQLTMAAAYHALDPCPRGTFELFVRRLPKNRRFLIFAGLEQALASIESLRFGPSHLAYLRQLPPFQQVPDSFFRTLEEFRFQGEVAALAEGTVFFPGEPVVQVRGSLLEAQLLETLLLTILNFQSAVASKAARIRLAAGPDARLAEFGGRRAHGPQAAAWVARAAYLAGFDATSNVLAGYRTGIPLTGTMAHSYVLAFEEEEEAFRHYQRCFPQQTILLVDTYDTCAAVERAAAADYPFQGVRLDSGDLGSLAREVRGILDRHGRREVQIFASGDLDELSIAQLVRQKAPIDAYGVGTRLASLADAPYLSGVYKLVEVEKEGRRSPRAKKSAEKASLPWAKQIYRRCQRGRIERDRLQRLEAPSPGPSWEPLLRPVLRDGERLERRTLNEAREHCRRQLAALPPSLRDLRELDEGGPSSAYPVEVELETP